MEVAKHEHAKSTQWRHLGTARIGMLCLAAQAKGTGMEEIVAQEQVVAAPYPTIETTILLSSRQKLGEATPSELCRRIFLETESVDDAMTGRANLLPKLIQQKGMPIINPKN